MTRLCIHFFMYSLIGKSIAVSGIRALAEGLQHCINVKELT